MGCKLGLFWIHRYHDSAGGEAIATPMNYYCPSKPAKTSNFECYSLEESSDFSCFLYSVNTSSIIYYNSKFPLLIYEISYGKSQIVEGVKMPRLTLLLELCCASRKSNSFSNLYPPYGWYDRKVPARLPLKYGSNSTTCVS